MHPSMKLDRRQQNRLWAARVMCRQIVAKYRRMYKRFLLALPMREPEARRGAYESYFCSALRVELNVNSSDSRGTLSTKGPTAQPRPKGMERVSETDSICI